MLETIFQRIGDRLAAEKHLAPKTDYPFGSTREDIHQFMTGMGEAVIYVHAIEINSYPFVPSIAYRQQVFRADEIKNISIQSAPPSLQVGNELIHISAEHREQLEKFALDNKLPIVSRSYVWDWILEPFLDTEFSKEHEENTFLSLSRYGLTRKEVLVIRSAVEGQMLKYNFDTMLWDWTGLDCHDVLSAMRPACYQDEFRELYQAVMRIALLQKKQ